MLKANTLRDLASEECEREIGAGDARKERFPVQQLGSQLLEFPTIFQRFQHFAISSLER